MTWKFAAGQRFAAGQYVLQEYNLPRENFSCAKILVVGKCLPLGHSLQQENLLWEKIWCGQVLLRARILEVLGRVAHSQKHKSGGV